MNKVIFMLKNMYIQPALPKTSKPTSPQQTKTEAQTEQAPPSPEGSPSLIRDIHNAIAEQISPPPSPSHSPYSESTITTSLKRKSSSPVPPHSRSIVTGNLLDPNGWEAAFVENHIKSPIFFLEIQPWLGELSAIKKQSLAKRQQQEIIDEEHAFWLEKLINKIVPYIADPIMLGIEPNLIPIIIPILQTALQQALQERINLPEQNRNQSILNVMRNLLENTHLMRYPTEVDDQNYDPANRVTKKPSIPAWMPKGSPQFIFHSKLNEIEKTIINMLKTNMERLTKDQLQERLIPVRKNINDLLLEALFSQRVEPFKPTLTTLLRCLELIEQNAPTPSQPNAPTSDTAVLE